MGQNEFVHLRLTGGPPHPANECGKTHRDDKHTEKPTEVTCLDCKETEGFARTRAYEEAAKAPWRVKAEVDIDVKSGSWVMKLHGVDGVNDLAMTHQAMCEAIGELVWEFLSKNPMMVIEKRQDGHVRRYIDEKAYLEGKTRP